MKLTANFWLQEFVPVEIWNVWGEKSIKFIDKRIVESAQWLRTFTGKRIIINDKFAGGIYNYSGFRQPNCSIGAELSQHKFGRGEDLKLEGMPASEVQEIIKAKFEVLRLKGITRMERGTPTWTHLDCAWTGVNCLVII